MTDTETFAIAVFITKSIFSLLCSISSLLEFQPFSLKTMTFLLNQFKALMQKKSFSTTQDKSCTKWASHMDEHNCEWFVTVSDIETVMKKLGIYSPSEQLESENDEKCRDCRLLEVVAHILEEDEASMEELNQAFSVYDENGDGFISALELQKVMRRLGMEEGVELENCEKMIAAFDVDGDGRIDLLEFTRMLENQR